MPANGRHIVAIRAGALGDTIVAVPAFAALRRIASRLEVVGTTPYIGLVPADAVHSMDRAGFAALFDDGADDTDLVGFLRRFDYVVAWSRLPLLAGMLARLNIELIQSTPLPPDGVHASDHLFAALSPLGITGPAPAPSLDVDGPRAGFPRKFVAIHPSSGSAAKNWDPENFASLARLAVADGFDVVWVQGEADGTVVPRLVDAVEGVVARELPLEELARVLADSAAFIGNDSGVSHLAAAVRAPTVAVFRTTDPVQWAPRGRRVHAAAAGASPEAVWGIACDLMDTR